MHEIEYSEGFRKQLRKLGDKGTEKQLLKAISALAEEPLKGEPLLYQLKEFRSLRCADDHRVVYKVEETTSKVIIVVSILYRHLPDI